MGLQLTRRKRATAIMFILWEVLLWEYAEYYRIGLKRKVTCLRRGRVEVGGRGGSLRDKRPELSPKSEVGINLVK